jgi:ribonuclease T1
MGNVVAELVDDDVKSPATTTAFGYFSMQLPEGDYVTKAEATGHLTAWWDQADAGAASASRSVGAMPNRAQPPSSMVRIVVGALLVLVVGGLIGWSLRGASSSSTTAPSASARATQAAGQRPTTTTTTKKPSKCVPISGVDMVSVDKLPSQAIDTLQSIAAGPPYPFKKDGVVFQNRERILPKESKSYYHEFTVVTPGSSDRGAKRIIVGGCDERWYTEDHYATFRLIEGSP